MYLALYLLHHLLLFPFFILFLFYFYSCGCIRVYQWSVQEPLSPRLATGYSPVDHWCSLSVLFLFSLAPNFGVFNNNKIIYTTNSV